MTEQKREKITVMPWQKWIVVNYVPYEGYDITTHDTREEALAQVEKRAKYDPESKTDVILGNWLEVVPKEKVLTWDIEGAR